ncbi:hypothetical protein BGZ83_008956 [Gryganskiella cystojenkinii]|nr:hypothetical protein BGZ83_008956 [Gryganskiella cystojenkinii]
MASINSRFDSTPASTSKDTSDAPWLSTYSRGLCSLYPKDEDACWDALLSSPASTSRSSTPLENSHPELRINHSSVNGRWKDSSHQQHPKIEATSSIMSTAEGLNSAAISSGATLYVKTDDGESQVSTLDVRGGGGGGRIMGSDRHQEDSEQLSISPQGGRLPHAICALGFHCVDILTASGAQEESASSTPLNHSPNAFLPRTTATGSVRDSNSRNPIEEEANSKIQEDVYEDKGNVDWAAAVCGKRTAALERKRVLSRTFSQESLEPVNHDPWFETLDRLSRWDEVAYR